MGQGAVTESLADRIRALRVGLGWSAQRLADECARMGFPALTRGTIAKIESGARKSVTAEEIAVLAHVLGVTPTDLLASPAWPPNQRNTNISGRIPPEPDANPDSSRLHLLLAVEPDGIDPRKMLVTSWRQDDTTCWPPVRGKTCMVSIEQLEQRVDELVVDAERAWASHSDSAANSVALEFILPRSLMNLPVHRWRKERNSEDGQPLAFDYLISVRSLARMRNTHWHRRWHQRWRGLQEDPSPERIHFVDPAELREPLRLGAVLSDSRWVAAVLTGPPAPHVDLRQRGDELTPALRSGIPALIWHPQESRDTMQEFVGSLVENDGLADLPARTRAARLNAYEIGAAFDDITRELVVLWDNPERLVPTDSLKASLVGV